MKSTRYSVGRLYRANCIATPIGPLVNTAWCGPPGVLVGLLNSDFGFWLACATAGFAMSATVSRIAEYLSRLKARVSSIIHIPDELERQRVLLGALSYRIMGNCPSNSLEDAELQVFSQFGEDGILQLIIQSFDAAVPRTFVEFGVETYREANTRLLMESRGWRGLVIDGDSRNIQAIHARLDYWRLPLTAVHAFIDRDNINRLIAQNKPPGPIGILSVDIDGNDYWVWEALDCIAPEIVVAEYNGLFGATSPVSIPYCPAFRRYQAHYSGLYFGCSLAALDHLARRKGYRLVGVNSTGANAFFVRAESSCRLPSRTVVEAFREPAFRQALSPDGRLSYATLDESRELIGQLPLVDVTTGKATSLQRVMTCD